MTTPNELHPRYPRTDFSREVDIRPHSEEMRDGTYQLDKTIRTQIQQLLSEDAPKQCAEAIWYAEPAKTFRNAYSMLVIEQGWPGYSETVANPTAPLFDIHYSEDGSTQLIPLDSDKVALMSAADTLEALAQSNRAALIHSTAELLSRNGVPQVTQDQVKNEEYVRDYQAMCELGRRYGIIFSDVPPQIDAGTTLIASATVTIKTHVFGIPAIIRAKAGEFSPGLTVAEQRAGFDMTMRRIVPHYFLPELAQVLALNGRLRLSLDVRGLDANQFNHNGDRNSFMVFPAGEIVDQANDAFAALISVGEETPVQTNCPAFKSRVKVTGRERPAPLSRAITPVALQQLDRWYYPKLQQELEA